MAYITCRDLAFSYENQIVFSGLSFAVNPGDYLCIVGENGAGKSTLMRTMLHLHTPVGGSMETGEGFQRTDIGYLPQQSEVQRDFPASVREIVLSGCQSRLHSAPFYGKAEKERARQMMERLGIAKLKNRSYRELSGGQRQRVLLARSLCATSRLLLLDEPMTGLDTAAAAELYRLLDQLNHERRLTILMVTHDVGEALRHATHVLHLAQDNRFFYGTAADYQQQGA